VEKDIDSAVHIAAKNADARLARSLRQEMATRGHLNACCMLALNLELNSEAEKILEKDSNALSTICQLQNKWQDAFLMADKIQIKSAYYNYAKHLEDEGKITEAIKFYEMSGNFLEVRIHFISISFNILIKPTLGSTDAL